MKLPSFLLALIRAAEVYKKYKAAPRCRCGHSSMSHYMCVDCTGCSQCDCKVFVR